MMLDIRDHGGKFGGGRGVKIKSIQRGIKGASNGVLNNTTITAVDLNKTIVFWSASWTRGTNPGSIRGDVWLSATNNLAMKLESDSSWPNIAVSYEVIEFSNVKKIQRIAYRYGTGYTGGPANLAIQSVNVAKTFVYSNLKNKRIQLTSPTTIEVFDGYGNGSISTDEFIYIVEME